jgi:hypothetical protein
MKSTRFLALPALLFLLILGSCRRETSLEQGITSVYNFQDVFGDCLGDSVVGNYIAGTQLNGDASYVEVKVNVHVPGRYSINSDIQNGFSFVGTGTFADTGLTTIRVPARGTPQQAGITTLRFIHDSTYCDINVNVTATAQGGGTCNAQVTGNYYKDTALRSTNTVTLSHNYTRAGIYDVTTDTINGYYFDGTITVTTPGATTVVLDGNGTPIATGTNNFTVNFDDSTSSCAFPITVSAATTGGGGGGSSCGTANGAYTSGTALTAANTVTFNGHTYATTGTYTARTNTVNGISFGPATVTVTSAGSTPSVTLAGTGTPTAAGTFSYNLDFGDGATCTFSVTVAQGGTTTGTLWPLTTGSWWSFSDPDSSVSTDSLLTTIVGQSTIGGNSYAFLKTTDGTGSPYDTSYVRKDASGIYQQNVDLNQMITVNGGGLVTFPAGARGELPLVKETLTTGATWLSPAFNGTASGVAAAVRISMRCTNSAATVTVNGNTFTNVYVVESVIEISVMGGPFTSNPFLPTVTTYYARNVGPIQLQADTQPPQNGIRYWHIQ